MSRKASSDSAAALGREFGKFPLRFAQPLLFGDIPSRQRPAKINNGTATLLRLRCGPVAITCFHVVEAYRERMRSGEPCLFQIAGCRFDPLNQLISESSELDLAVMRLTPEQIEAVMAWPALPSQFHTPVRWPPAQASQGDDVLFGGYPGKWRTALNYDELRFATYTEGHRVTAAGLRSFFCEVDQKHSVKTIYHDGLKDLTEFGGMSGGPVFAVRSLYLEFVGVVKEYSVDRNAFHFTHASLVDEDGQINV